MAEETEQIMWRYRKDIFILILLTVSGLFSFKTQAQNFKSKVDSLNEELIRKKQKTEVLLEINKDELLRGRYLGSLRVKKTKEVYVICIIYEYNIQVSRTAESHIFLYNQNGQYVGNYFLSTIDQLPFSIEENCLWFKKPNHGIFKISFENGIPRFIKIFGSNGSRDFAEFKS